MRSNLPRTIAVSACIFFAAGSVFADEGFSNLMKSGKYQEAVKYAEKQIPGASRTIDIWLDLALASEKSGLPKDQVLACYKEAQKINPSDPNVHFALGSYYFGTKNYAEAIKLFQSSFLLKRNAAAAEKMALCAAELNQWDKAKDAAESAVSLDSTVTECRPILVKLNIAEKNWSAVVENLEIIAKKSPQNLDMWKQLADAYDKAGMKDRFPRADSMIVLLDKNNIASRLRFADHSLVKKDTTAATVLFKELAILAPSNPKPFKSLFILSKAQKKSEDATLYLKNYLVLDSSDADLHWQLGDLLYAAKDLTGALESYRRGFKRNPQVRGHLRQYADIALQKKLDDEAIKIAGAAISANEADIALYTAIGDIHRRRNQCPAAVKMYQEALKTEPNNIQVLGAMADCQAKTGDTKNAIIAYEQLVLMNPQPANEYKALGDLQLKVGKRDEAMKAYKKHLDNRKNDFAVAKTVGLYSYEAKQYGDAVKYLTLVTDQNLRDQEFLTALGLSSFQLNDCKTAIEALAKVFTPKTPAPVLLQVLKPLGECYERGNAALKAAEAYVAYSSLPGVNDPDIAYRGAFLKESTDKPGAAKAYAANTAAYPKDYRNFLRLGLLYAADSTALGKASPLLTAASGLVDTVRILWRTLAIVERKLNNENKELLALTKLITLEPQDTEGNRRLGTILAGRKQHAQAIAPLEVAATSSQDYSLLHLLATCYLETKRPKEALTLLRKAKTSKPDDPAIRVSIINAAASIVPPEPADKEKEELADIDKKICSKDKKNIESRVRLVQYYYDTKDLNNAYPLLKELSVLTPKDQVVYRRLYEISVKNGNKNEASEYLKKYLAIDPNNPNAYKSLGDLLFEQKDFDGAIGAYRTTAKLNPQLKGFYKNYIYIILDKKLDAEAIPVIQNAIKLGEADLVATVALGDIFRKKGQCGEAIKLYQDALKLDPKNLEVMASLSECQTATGDVKNAIISYEQLVLLKPKPTKEYKLLGDLQMKTGKVDAGIASYQKYLADAHSDQAIARTVGIYLYNQKSYKDAIGNLELVKDAALQNVDYLVALGDCYHQTGQSKKAVDIFAKTWAAKPAPTVLVRILKILAESYEKSGETARALEAYDAYTKLPGVKDQEASYLCGFLREKTDKNGAIRAYAANTSLFPKDYRNFLRLGLLLATDETALDRSAQSLKAAAALVDTFPVLWETLARNYKKLKNDEGELLALQKLLSLQPQNLESNKRVSALLLKKKQVGPAITNLEMVLTMSPNDVETMLLLADGYLETKRPTQAMDLLSKAKAIDRNNIALRTKLYELSRQNNQDQQAETEIKGLIELTKDNKYRIMYARDLATRARYDEAMKIISDIKTSDPMNIEAIMLRGSIQKTQKKYEEAIETYKEISYINEDYVPATCERGDTYLLMMQYDRALQYFTKAQKADPRYAPAELGLALVAKAQKNMPLYQEHIAKAKALDPKNARIQSEAAAAGIK